MSMEGRKGRFMPPIFVDETLVLRVHTALQQTQRGAEDRHLQVPQLVNSYTHAAHSINKA